MWGREGVARVCKGKARRKERAAWLGWGALGQGVLTSALLTFGSQELLLEGSPVHHRVLGSIPDLYPLAACCTPTQV